MDTVEIPAKIASAVATATLPTNYVAMKHAIAECVRVDELADMSDKAAAVATYARMAEDRGLEKDCLRIRARAVRRIGELLKEIDARGQHRKRGVVSLSRTAAATAAGMSDDQRKTAVRLASIAEDEFEEKVESSEPPGLSVLAAFGRQCRARPNDRILTGADLHKIGERSKRDAAVRALRDLQHNNCDVGLVLDHLLQPENHKMLEIAKQALAFARRIERALNAAGVSTVTPLRPML